MLPSVPPPLCSGMHVEAELLDNARAATIGPLVGGDDIGAVGCLGCDFDRGAVTAAASLSAWRMAATCTSILASSRLRASPTIVTGRARCCGRAAWMMPMLAVVSSSMRPKRHGGDRLGGDANGVDAVLRFDAGVRGFAVTVISKEVCEGAV